MYDAIVIDNTNFLSNGTIRVRIFAHFNYPRTKADGTETNIDDLSTDVNLITIAERTTTDYLDYDALVFTPFGGGRNFGLMYLPQVNTKGVVAFLDADHHKPIWLGNYFEAKHDVNDYKTIKYVNAPSDDLLKDGENKDMSADQNINFDGVTTDELVFRQKHTTFNRNSLDDMNFQKQDTENLILMDKNKITIRHFSGWDNGDAKFYQDITIGNGDGKDATITMTAVDVDNSKTTSVEMSSEEITVTADDGNSPTIKMSLKGKDGITFIDDNDNLVTYKDLKTIVDKIEKHKHVRFPSSGSDGMTGEPVTGQGTPLSSDIATPKRDMQAKLLKAHPKGS
jgi:hypothetical protein